MVGARPGETLVADSATVDLYKLAGAVLAARPERRAVVTARTNAPRTGTCSPGSTPSSARVT